MKDSNEDSKAAIENERYIGNTIMRKRIVVVFLILKYLWLGSVIFLLIRNKLTENVFLMLLGTTTINIVGLSYIIFKNVFPERVIKEDEELNKET